MPPKRMHTKSRNGCMTCRRRRVKCDEIRPICTNCTRRELDCVYAAYCPPGRPGRPGISFSRSSSSSSTTTHPPPSQALSPRLRTLPLPPPPQQPQTSASTKPRRCSSTNSTSAATLAALARQFDLLILEARARSPPSPLPRISLSGGDLDNLSLLHHFTIRTYNSLTNDGSGEEIFRARFPRIALQNELAMHSLLAVTALHRSKTAGASLVATRYQMIAASYYDRALSSLRIAILDPSQNATALFAASAMIAFYGLGCHPTGSQPSHIRFFAWIPLVRGVHAVIKQWWKRVKEGPLAPLTEQGALGLLEGSNVLPLPESLFDLALETPHTLNKPHVCDDEIVDAVAASIYRRVLDELRTSWSNFWATGYRLATCIQWLILAPNEYILYLQEGRPRALVIFCHFLCMIKKLDGFWWLKGSAQETFIAIERRLSTRWKEPWLELPTSIIMGDCEVVGESL